MSDQSLALRDTITPEEYARNAAKIEGAKAYLASLEAKNEAGKQKFEADLMRRIQEGEQAKQLLANMGRYTTVGPNSAMETLPSSARIEEVSSTSPPTPQMQWNQSNGQHSQASSSQPNPQYGGRDQPNGHNPVHQQYQSGHGYGQSGYSGPYSNTRYNYSTSYPAASSYPATSSTQTQHFLAPSLRSEPPQYSASQPQNVPLQRPLNQVPAQGSGQAPVAPTRTPQQPSTMNWIATPASDAPEDRMKSILDFRSAVITWASQAPPSSYVDVNSVRVFKDPQSVVYICRYTSNGDPIKQGLEVFFAELITQLQRSQQVAAVRSSQLQQPVPQQSGRSTTIAQSEATIAGSNSNGRVPQNSDQARPNAQPSSVKSPTIVIPPRPPVHQTSAGQPQPATKVTQGWAPTAQAKTSGVKTIPIRKSSTSSTMPSSVSNAQPSALQQAKGSGSSSKDADTSTTPTRTSTPSTTSTSSLADALQRQVTPPAELSVPIPVTPDLLQRQRTLVNGVFRSPQDANKKRLARDLLTALGKRKADPAVEVGSAAKRAALDMKVVEMGGQKHVWQGNTFQSQNMHYSTPQGPASGVFSGYVGGDIVVPRPAQPTFAVPLTGRPPLPAQPQPQPPVHQQPLPPAQPQLATQPTQSQLPAHPPNQSHPQAQAQVATVTLPPQSLLSIAQRILSAPQNNPLNPSDGRKPGCQIPAPSRAGNASAVAPALGVIQPEAASSQKSVAAPALTNGANGTGGAPTSAMNVLPPAAAVPSSVMGKETVNGGVIPVAQVDTGKGSVEVKAKDVPPPSQSTVPTTAQTPTPNAPLQSKGVANTAAPMNIPLLEPTSRATKPSASASTSKSAPKPKPKAKDPAPSSSAFAPKARAPEIIDLSSPTRGTTPIPIVSSSTDMPLFLPSPPSSASAGPLPPSSRASMSGESVQSRRVGGVEKVVKRQLMKRQRFYIEVPPPPGYLVEYREQEKRKGRSGSEGSAPSVAIISRPGSRVGGREREVFEGYVNEPVVDPEEQEAIENSSSRLQPTTCRWAECNIVLNSADTLMRHLTMQHEQAAIGSSRNQSFICRWTQCGRQSRSGDRHVEKHALLPLRCAYKDCKDSFRSGPQLLKHNRKQHSKSELKPPAMPFVGQVLAPLVRLPRNALPANMFVTAPVLAKSIKPDRHKVIGQWVARNILGCGEDQEKHRNPLKRAKKTARPVEPNRDPYPSYEFLDDRTVRYGSLLSQSIDLRTENLDSVALSREFDEGLTLWPPQPPAPPPEELGRGDRSLSPLDLEMGDVLMGDGEDGDHRSMERDAETVEVEDMLIGTNSPIL